MNPRLSFVVAAATVAPCACSAASNIGVAPPVNTNFNLIGDTQTGAPAVPDPAYGTEYGMGGKFQPFTVPGF